MTRSVTEKRPVGVGVEAMPAATGNDPSSLRPRSTDRRSRDRFTTTRTRVQRRSSSARSIRAVLGVPEVGILSNVVENGKAQRVRLMREDDYKAIYGPLISLVSEKCNNDNAIDVALGRAMEEHRFVIALTFEKLHNRRARHLRAMVIREETLRSLPNDCPRVDFEEHRTRYRTLQAIARQYAARPECFGIVKVWRPKLQSVAVPAIDKTMRFEPDRAAE